MKKKTYEGTVINITNDDYKNAVWGDGCECAAARAIKRQLKVKDVIVGEDEILINEVVYQTPSNISEMINRFDEELDFDGCSIIDYVQAKEVNNDNKSFSAYERAIKKMVAELAKGMKKALVDKKKKLKPCKLVLTRTEEESNNDKEEAA